MTPAQIRSALTAGIISQQQANDMLLKQGAAPLSEDAAVIGNEDEMRFIRGFSDIFIAIGMVILLIGMLVFSAAMGGSGIPFLAAAGISFLLAEYFGRKKRQHLPTLVTAIGFMFFIIIGVSVMMGMDRFSSSGNIVAAVISVAAMFLFYYRIKLPFCMALIAYSLVYLGFSIIATAFDVNLTLIGVFLFLSGIAIVWWALKYDVKDPDRMTRYADNAFWLHLVSAPLIIHGLVVLFIGVTDDLSSTTAFATLGIVLMVGLFGLAIDRRAFLTSSLVYAGMAIGYFMYKVSLDPTLAIAFTLLLLGSAVVFLGAGWDTARAGLLKVLPKWKIFRPKQV
ncbi:MAG: hypothetical protein HKN36_04855 [Hellea sp.]|nr:hypothetical protein [Hellea sp.]